MLSLFQGRENVRKLLRRSSCLSLAALGLAVVALTLPFFRAGAPAVASPPCSFATLSTSSNFVSYGSPLTLFGHCFASGETVKLLWNYRQRGQLQVASVAADSRGNFSYTLNAPSDPNLGTVRIAAFRMTSRLQPTALVHEAAALLLAESPCDPFIIGLTLFINGGGFGSDEPVTLSINGNVVGSVSTGLSGAFTRSMLISCDGPFYNTLQATGTLSGVSLSASFGRP